VTPGPGHRQCTPYLWPGPGGTPLALPLTEWLGSTGPRLARGWVRGRHACSGGPTAACATPRRRTSRTASLSSRRAKKNLHSVSSNEERPGGLALWVRRSTSVCWTSATAGKFAFGVATRIGHSGPPSGVLRRRHLVAGERTPKALTLMEHCTAAFVMPNVRVNRRAEAGRLGPVGENVPRTADRAKVACRSASS